MSPGVRTNTVSWFLLLLLSGASLHAGGRGHGIGVAALLLAAAAAKSAVVGWQYMELRSAHVLWKAGFASLLVGLLAALLLLARR